MNKIPEDARVTIDGETMGFLTPATVIVPVGRHTVSVTRDNKRSDQEIWVTEDKTAKLQVVLPQ
jgi:PEGA domain-containing protein